MNCHLCKKDVSMFELHDIRIDQLFPKVMEEMSKGEYERFYKCYPRVSDIPKHEVCEDCLGWND